MSVAQLIPKMFFSKGRTRIYGQHHLFRLDMPESQSHPKYLDEVRFLTKLASLESYHSLNFFAAGELTDEYKHHDIIIEEAVKRYQKLCEISGIFFFREEGHMFIDTGFDEKVYFLEFRNYKNLLVFVDIYRMDNIKIQIPLIQQGFLDYVNNWECVVGSNEENKFQVFPSRFVSSPEAVFYTEKDLKRYVFNRLMKKEDMSSMYVRVEKNLEQEDIVGFLDNCRVFKEKFPEYETCIEFPEEIKDFVMEVSV